MSRQSDGDRSVFTALPRRVTAILWTSTCMAIDSALAECYWRARNFTSRSMRAPCTDWQLIHLYDAVIFQRTLRGLLSSAVN